MSGHELEDTWLGHLQLEETVEERSSGGKFEVREDLEKVG